MHFEILFQKRPRLPGDRKGKAGGGIKLKPCNENIEKAIQLSETMIRLADAGDMDREDVGCGILYGILRDAAYRIRKTAESEKAAHMQKGTWK
jgi:hypothetical protein